MFLLCEDPISHSRIGCQNPGLHQYQVYPESSDIVKIILMIPKHELTGTTLKRAMTAEKQHMNNVAKTSDFVGAKGLFRT
jgi:hypothetical protein